MQTGANQPEGLAGNGGGLSDRDGNGIRGLHSWRTPPLSSPQERADGVRPCSNPQEGGSLMILACQAVAVQRTAQGASASGSDPTTRDTVI